MNAILIHEEESTHQGTREMPSEMVSEGNPKAETWVSASFPAAKTVQTGIWIGEPGKLNVPYYPHDEIFTVLSGKIEMTNEDGSKVIVGPGESGLLRKGWKGVWHTVERTRKCFTTSED